MRGTNDGEQLHGLLESEIDTLARDAEAAGGAVDPERLQRAQHLSDLIELRARQRHRPQRWFPLAAATITLVIGSVLLFVRTPSTEIELRALTSELTFTPAVRQRLSEQTVLRSIEAIGLSGFDGPFAWRWTPRDSSQVHIHAVAGGNPPGVITLDPITAPVGVRVWIRHRADSLEYALSFRGLARPPIEARADYVGSVRFESPRDPSVQRVVAASDELILSGAANGFDLSMVLAEGQSFVLAPLLPVSRLGLLALRDESADDVHQVVAASAVVSGSIFFESLDGRERVIRPAEPIRFDSLTGEIRSLRAAVDGIHITFHGAVRGLRVDSGSSARSLMPTWFEWLHARQELALIWGTSLYLVGLAMAARRWWTQSKA